MQNVPVLKKKVDKTNLKKKSLCRKTCESAAKRNQLCSRTPQQEVLRGLSTAEFTPHFRFFPLKTTLSELIYTSNYSVKCFFFSAV